MDRGKGLQNSYAAPELVTGLDGLLIEGFDEAGPGRRRYLLPGVTQRAGSARTSLAPS